VPPKQHVLSGPRQPPDPSSITSLMAGTSALAAVPLDQEAASVNTVGGGAVINGGSSIQEHVLDANGSLPSVSKYGTFSPTFIFPTWCSSHSALADMRALLDAAAPRESSLQFFPQLSKNLQLIKIGLDQFLHLPGYSTLNRKYSPAFQMHAITNQNWNRVRHFLLSLASNPQL